jgi:hypothetical protein
MKKLLAILWLVLTAGRETKLQEVKVKSCWF